MAESKSDYLHLYFLQSYQEALSLFFPCSYLLSGGARSETMSLMGSPRTLLLTLKEIASTLGLLSSPTLNLKKLLTTLMLLKNWEMEASAPYTTVRIEKAQSSTYMSQDYHRYLCNLVTFIYATVTNTSISFTYSVLHMWDTAMFGHTIHTHNLLENLSWAPRVHVS